jgi:uncharacterized coiled-coil DUF342 family protein
MDIDTLRTKRDEVSQRFDFTKEELSKLQGEYRAYDSLINELETASKDDGNGPDSPTKIEVKE